MSEPSMHQSITFHFNFTFTNIGCSLIGCTFRLFNECIFRMSKTLRKIDVCMKADNSIWVHRTWNPSKHPKILDSIFFLFGDSFRLNFNLNFWLFGIKPAVVSNCIFTNLENFLNKNGVFLQHFFFCSNVLIMVFNSTEI